MKIVVVSRDLRFKGGVVNFARLLMDGLREEGHDVIHFVEGKKPEGRNILLPFSLISQYYRFSRMLSDEKPDVVHLNPSMGRVPMWRDGILARKARKKGSKVLIFVHGWNEEYFKNSVRKGIFSGFHRKTFDIADGIILSSPRYKRDISELVTKEEDRISWLPTMVETEKYRAEKSFDGRLNILFCGAMLRDKGVYEILEAFKIIRNEHDVRMIFMGDGPETERLMEKCGQYGLERDVTFTGFLRDDAKYRVFKDSHIFLFPSYHEGFPTVIPEAMAAGMVPVMTEVGGLPYLLKDGVHGYFLKNNPPEPEEIAEKAINLIRNRSAMMEISERNVRDAFRLFDYRSVVERILKMYSGL